MDDHTQLIGGAGDLRQEIVELKAEIARLVIDYRNLRETYSELYNHYREAIELLQSIRVDPDLADTRRVELEIIRLRGLVK